MYVHDLIRNVPCPGWGFITFSERPLPLSHLKMYVHGLIRNVPCPGWRFITFSERPLALTHLNVYTWSDQVLTLPWLGIYNVFRASITLAAPKLYVHGLITYVPCHGWGFITFSERPLALPHLKLYVHGLITYVPCHGRGLITFPERPLALPHPQIHAAIKPTITANTMIQPITIPTIVPTVSPLELQQKYHNQCDKYKLFFQKSVSTFST